MGVRDPGRIGIPSLPAKAHTILLVSPNAMLRTPDNGTSGKPGTNHLTKIGQNSLIPQALRSVAAYAYISHPFGSGIGLFNSFAVSIHSRMITSTLARACLYVGPSAPHPRTS